MSVLARLPHSFVNDTTRLLLLTRGACAVSLLLVVARGSGAALPDVTGGIAMGICLVLFMASIARLLPLSRGVRRRVYATIGVGSLAAALAQLAALGYLAFDIPARFPTLDLVILMVAVHPVLIIGLASAVGYRREVVGDEQLIDTLLLIAAAAIVGIALGYIGAPDLGGAARGSETFLFFWRWLPMAELMLVAMLLAVQGARLGTMTSAGLALGTVAMAIAAMMHVRLSLLNPAAALTQNDMAWAVTLLMYSIALDVPAPGRETPNLPHHAVAEPDSAALDIIGTRGRYVVVAILIAAVATVALGFRPKRSPELAVIVAAFGLLLAIRAWRALRRQQFETRQLALSITAERAVASVLEHRVTERTSELAEAQRVLQRMLVLGQQITIELNPTRVLQRFVEAAMDIAQADGALLALTTDDANAKVVAATGSGAPTLGVSVPIAGSAIGRVIRGGKHWLGDLERDRDSLYLPLHDLAEPGLRSVVIIPLQRRGETIGSIGVYSKRSDHFGPAHVERITTLADILSVALANAELVETLRQTEWRFRTLFRSAPDAVLTVLQSGRIREANDAVRALAGVEPQHVVGRFLGQLVIEEDQPRLRDALQSAFNGVPSRAEVRVPKASGPGTLVVDIAASRLPEAEPPAVLIIARDISEEREMRARLMETERLAAVGELVAGVAHEVNNPLSSISAFAQLMLRDGGLNASQRDSIEVIKSEALRASYVVRDLLAFARRSEPRHDALDLNQVVDRSLRLRAYELSSSHIKVEPSLALDLPAVMGDGRQLQQVILNLITNAIQAMAPQGGGTLGLATYAENGRVVLEIVDTGPGISPDDRLRIFEPFFTTKDEGQGTGLGLSVSYGIVNAHGGTIECADSSGEGTRFVVTLPAAEGVIASPPEVESEPPPARSLLAGTRILFADDEAAIRDGIERYARLRGFEVVTAVDGRDALRALRATGFDALVCDVRMPNLDGPGLYEILRREQPGLAGRTLFVTGDVIGEVVPGGISRTPVLPKPFTFERLEGALVALLRGQAIPV